MEEYLAHGVICMVSFLLSFSYQYNTLTGSWLDGGVKVSMYLNDKFTCTSNAVYGDKAESSSGMGGHSHGDGGDKKSSTGIKTISSMTPCGGPYQVKKGDTMNLVAEYNLAQHPLRQTSGGKAADVMGMMGIYFSASK